LSQKKGGQGNQQVARKGDLRMQQPNEEDVMMDNQETILVMVHKRIRKRAGYDIDSAEITTALEQSGYPMSEDDVLQGLAELKEAGYLRAFEDYGNDNRVIRYWGLEITPQGAMRAIDLMNQFRYGA
jgi:hypothetical protein